MTHPNLPVPATRDSSSERSLERPDAAAIVNPLRHKAELTTRARARSVAFAAAIVLGVPLAALIAALVEPPLPVAFFLIYLPCLVILGLLAERLPLHRHFTSPEELALERVEARHRQRIADIEARVEPLRAAGISPKELAARQGAAYSAEHAEHLAELEDLAKHPRRVLPPST
ncbi:MAG: hypothetical protein IPK80_06685 [Nannocystis sp.]|nr:hypothetical protein [Nannocystis sp.]